MGYFDISIKGLKIHYNLCCLEILLEKRIIVSCALGTLPASMCKRQTSLTVNRFPVYS
jgi:hypothetical protein